MAASNILTGRIQLAGADELKSALADLASAGQRAFAQLQVAAGSLKLDLSTEKTRTELEALGKAGADAFKQIGDAAKSAELSPPIDETKSSFTALEDAGRRAIGALTGGAETLKSSYGDLSKIVTSIKDTLSGTPAKALLVGTGITGVLAELFKLVKDGIDDFAGLQKKADETNRSLEDFQKIKFILQEMGLSSKDAEKAIEDFGNKADEAGKKAAKSIGDINAGFRATAAQIAFEAAQEKLRTAQGDKADTALQAELAERKAILDVEQARFQIKTLRAQQESKLGPKIITAPEVVSPESLERLAKSVALIDDYDRQVERAKQLLGNEDLAKKFVQLVDDVGIEKALTLFDKLRRVTKDGTDTADEFAKAQRNLSRSLVEVGFASAQGRDSLALMFAPALTPIINGFANGIRFLNEALHDNGSSLKQFAKDIGDSVKPVIEDFFRLLSGKGDTEINTQWLVTLRDGVVAFGKGVQEVFESVVKPAFFGLVSLAGDAAKSLNEAFGTNVSGTFVALIAGLATFTSGWRALAVAVLAAVGVLKSANVDLSGLFKTFDIDFSGAIASIKQFGATLKDAIKTGDASGLVESFKTLPGIILVVVSAVLALYAGARLLAPVLARLFGVEVSAGGVAFLAVISQASGLLPLLTTLLSGAAAASVLIVNSFQFLLLAIGGVGTAILGAIAAIFIFRDDLRQAANNGSLLAAGLLLVADAIEIVAGAVPSLVKGVIDVIDTALPIIAKFIEAAIKVASGDIVGAGKAFADLVKKIDETSVKLLQLDQSKKTLAQQAGLDDIGKSLEGSGTKADGLRTKIDEVLKSLRGLLDGSGTAAKGALDNASGGLKDITDAAAGGKAAFTDLGSGISVAASEIAAAMDRSRGKIIDVKKSLDDLRAAKQFVPDVSGGLEPGLTPLIDPRTGEQLVGLRAKLQNVTDAAVTATRAMVDFVGLPANAAAGKFSVPIQTPGILTEEDSFRQDIARAREVLDALRLSGFGASATGGSILSRLIPESLPGNLAKANEALTATQETLKGLTTDADQVAAPIDRINSAFDALTQKRSALDALFDGAKAKASELLNLASKVASALNPISSAQAGTLAQSTNPIPINNPAQSFNEASGAADGFTRAIAGAKAGVVAVNNCLALLADNLITDRQNTERLGNQFDALGQSSSGVAAAIAAAAPGFGPLVAAAQGAGQAIGNAFATVGSAISEPIKGALSVIQQAVTAIDFSPIAASAQSAALSAIAAMQQIIDAAKQAAAATAGAVAGGAAGGISGSGGDAGFSGGGSVWGPGTATSDSILARLSRGEFVIRAAAVSHFGPQFFAALNALRMPRFNMGGLVEGLGRAMAMPMPGFAAGGPVLAPAFAGGGAGSSGTPVHLHFGGKVFQVSAAPNVVDDLKRAAALENLTSTGPAPSWFGR